MSTLRKIATALLSLVLGALLAEGFLRLLIPVEAQYETWFTPGIEEWDDTFGAVYRPNWKGTMRHIDGVYRGVPLQLDEGGFRRKAKNDLPGEPVKVLLMGGRSAMMSYGLPDAESIPSQMVKAADYPMEVQSISWAGGNLIRNWNLYRRHLRDERYDLVIISHVNPYLPAFKDHTTFDRVPPPPSPEWTFRYMDGIVLWRDGLFMEIGRPAFASYLGYGIIRLADAAIKEFNAFGKESGSGMREVIQRQAQAPGEAALTDYVAFLQHVREYFSSRETPVVLHFIPRPYAAPDHHAPFRRALSNEWEIIDLNRDLHDALTPDAFIANGHYGRELAHQIGQALEMEVRTRLFVDKP